MATGQTLKAGVKATTGDWLGIASDIIGIGGNIMGLFGGDDAKKASARQYQYNLALQKQAQQWQENFYQHRYQWQRQDLESAGINPLYGLGTAPMGSAGTNSVGMPDMVNERAQKRQAILQGLQLATDWSAKQADINLKNKQANTEEFNSLLKQYEAIGENLNNLYKQKELSWYDKRQVRELERQKSEIIKNMSEVRKNSEDIGLIRENTNTARENTANAKKIGEGIEQENIKKSRTNEWHKKHPIYSSRALKRQEYGGSFNSAGDMTYKLLKALL